MKKTMVRFIVIVGIVLSILLLAEMCYASPVPKMRENKITVYLFGDINSDTLYYLQTQIYTLWRDHGKRPISHLTININSYGGRMDYGFVVYHWIMELRREGLHVTTKVDGNCASAATLILQAGTIRKASVDAMIMTHSPLYMIEPKGEIIVLTDDDLKYYKDGLEKARLRMMEVFVRRTGRTLNQLDEYFQVIPRDMKAREALEAGFLDIIEPEPISRW